MSKVIVISLTLVIAATSLAITYKNNAGDRKNYGVNDRIKQKGFNNTDDLMEAMTTCNDSFRIETEYLTSLNETGSFPDETDKTPKCFIRCVLMSLNIASPEKGVLDPQRAAIVFAGERNGKEMEDIEDITTTCVTGRNETCQCEMAYNFMKCVFSKEIEKYQS